MKKVILCVGLYLVFPFTIKNAIADEAVNVVEAKVAAYISTLYNQIDFSGCEKLGFDVFDKACHGYLNLRNAGKMDMNNNIITICDFSLSSTEKRMWIIDLEKKKVLYNTLVAHGQGSGDEYATSFSNKENTHKSSLGFYVTGETYQGEHGTSLRLQGMDAGFNDAAFDRGIVVHGAEYVSNRFINTRDRLGRSWGCPAVPTKLSLPIINTIKNGSCLYIHYPETKYQKTAYWLNKKVSWVPENNMLSGSIAGEAPKGPRQVVIEYRSNGRVDSVKTISASIQ